MEKRETNMAYHANLNPIIQNIQDELDQKLPLENVELEHKYAYLKYGPKDGSFNNTLKSSQTKPIVINTLKNVKQYKVNAKC